MLTTALCNQLQQLYHWKYALIALRVYFGLSSQAKNNTGQNKARVARTHNNLHRLWSVQSRNYSAAIMKYCHAITQQFSAQSHRAVKVQRGVGSRGQALKLERLVCCFSVSVDAICVCVDGCATPCEACLAQGWVALTWGGRAWWIMKQLQSC